MAAREATLRRALAQALASLRTAEAPAFGLDVHVAVLTGSRLPATEWGVFRAPDQTRKECQLLHGGFQSYGNTCEHAANLVDLETMVDCLIPPLGRGEARFEPLAALQEALGPGGQGLLNNAGFRRPHASLAVIIIGDSDDASLDATHPGQLSPAELTWPGHVTVSAILPLPVQVPDAGAGDPAADAGGALDAAAKAYPRLVAVSHTIVAFENENDWQVALATPAFEHLAVEHFLCAPPETLSAAGTLPTLRDGCTVMEHVPTESGTTDIVLPSCTGGLPCWSLPRNLQFDPERCETIRVQNSCVLPRGSSVTITCPAGSALRADASVHL